MKGKMKLEKLNIKDVEMLPGQFLERMNVNARYLLELDTDCLLQNYYLEAGMTLPGMQSVSKPDEVNMHWGWEAPSCQLRGHFLGHWMSAAAKLTAGVKVNDDQSGWQNGRNDDDRVPGRTDLLSLRAKLIDVVSGLRFCQKKNGGRWVGPIPEKYFDILMTDDYIWSPQYTMHKLLMGLVDTYIYTGSDAALEIADNLADWYVDWVKKCQDINPAAVYSGEQAGMLELWVKLLEIKGTDKYKFLVKSYMDNSLFEKLDKTNDALADLHANASIPIMHGAAVMYMETGEDIWKERLLKFWDQAVTTRGMLATTGANAGEFWIPKMQIGAYIGNRDQEFCTVYNMVRTADYLYRITGETRFADYIERALYNGFLAQQNRNTGMPTYFLPLIPGSKKVWGSKRHDFWCCTGTMVQSQTLYPELICYKEDKSIIVSQYIPSSAVFMIDDVEVKLTQRLNMKNYDNQVLFDEKNVGGKISRWSLKFRIETSKPVTFDLKLRIPVWSEDVRLEGADISQKADGYMTVTKEWKDDEMTVEFGSSPVLEPLPDEPDRAAIVDGPIVLAALADNDPGLKIKDDLKHTLVRKTEHTYDTFVWKQNNYMTRGQDKNYNLIPLFDVTDEAYTVYLSVDNT